MALWSSCKFYVLLYILRYVTYLCGCLRLCVQEKVRYQFLWGGIFSIKNSDITVYFEHWSRAYLQARDPLPVRASALTLRRTSFVGREYILRFHGSHAKLRILFFENCTWLLFVSNRKQRRYDGINLFAQRTWLSEDISLIAVSPQGNITVVLNYLFHNSWLVSFPKTKKASLINSQRTPEE